MRRLLILLAKKLSASKESFVKSRVFENSHILFWLLKDMSWAFGFKLLGILMIFPTLLISIIVTFMLRDNKREWYHNNAVSCWILQIVTG